MGLVACAHSIDSYQPANWCSLIRIVAVCFLVRNNPLNQEAESVDPYQTALMCQLNCIYTVRSCVTVIPHGVKSLNNEYLLSMLCSSIFYHIADRKICKWYMLHCIAL